MTSLKDIFNPFAKKIKSMSAHITRGHFLSSGITNIFYGASLTVVGLGLGAPSYLIIGGATDLALGVVVTATTGLWALKKSSKKHLSALFDIARKEFKPKVAGRTALLCLGITGLAMGSRLYPSDNDGHIVTTDETVQEKIVTIPASVGTPADPIIQ